MAQTTTMGLVLHSNFARHYAAARRENPIGHAEAAAAHVAHASAIQEAHMTALEAHMAQRNAGTVIY